MSTKKYIITEETHPPVFNQHFAHLHRIVACRAIPTHGVREGDKGGWVETEGNLSHEGAAWVAGEASATGASVVRGDALLCHFARISGNAILEDAAIVSGAATICDNARVGGDARLGGERQRPVGFLSDAAYAKGGGDGAMEMAYDTPSVSGYAVLDGSAKMTGDALLCERAHLGGNAQASGDAVMTGNVDITGSAVVASGALYLSGQFGQGLLKDTQEETFDE